MVSILFYFHPENWGRFPFWRAYVSKGLKPPTWKSIFPLRPIRESAKNRLPGLVAGKERKETLKNLICTRVIMISSDLGSFINLIPLSQWLNFKLFGITYLVGKISRSNLFFQGPLAEWVITRAETKITKGVSLFFIAINVQLPGHSWFLDRPFDLRPKFWRSQRFHEAPETFTTSETRLPLKIGRNPRGNCPP